MIPQSSSDVQVPAAVNTVNTENNAQLQQDEEAGQQEGSRKSHGEDMQQVKA